MKSVLSLLCFLGSFLLYAQPFFIDDNINSSNKRILSSSPDYLTNESYNKSETDNCKFYLKYPPVVSSFFNNEDSWEKIELTVKDEYSKYDIELSIKFHFFYNQEAISYKMYDDGTHGDSIEGDHIFTNDNVFFPHKGLEVVTSIAPCPITIYIKYLSNSSLIHTDEVWMDFYNVNPDFLTNLEVPEFKYLNHDKSVIWADNFIAINKNKNWGELATQQHGSGCLFDYKYIESESILYNYWDESQIINNSDNNFYLQADFIEPSGQYAYPDGETMFLGTRGLFGPFVHELLHRWNVEMNNQLGFSDWNDTFSGHYAGIVRNTSGFLYQSYGRFPWMFCEGAQKNVIQENDTTYTLIYTETCTKDKNKQIFNDYEQYIMGLIPIDSVKFPIYFLDGFKKFEEKIDPNTGYSLDTFKVYFRELIKIDKPKLENAKKSFLANHSGNQNFLSGDTINVIPVFNLSKNPSIDELKIINFFCSDISRKGPTNMNYKFHGLDFLTYYEATQGKGIIVCNVPIPKNQIVNAGKDQRVNEGETVTLNGYASSNTDGNSLTYKWTAPPGITLSSTTVANPTFAAPEVTSNTNYTFSLVVNDGTVDSPADQVVITVKNVNKGPIVYAGSGQSVNEGTKVTLDGSASFDPDGNPLTYKWTAPAGITLSSTTIAQPTFTAPEINTDTNYTFSLVVNDGTVDSNPSMVNIAILNVIKVGNTVISASIFKVYPNPTRGIITLEFNQNSGKRTKVLVLNMIGAEVFRKELTNVDNYLIDLSNQVNGIYLLKVFIDNQQYVKKIVIRKQ